MLLFRPEISILCLLVLTPELHPTTVQCYLQCYSASCSIYPGIYVSNYYNHYTYHGVPGKCPWALKHILQFWAAWALTQDQNSICMYVCIEDATVAP